MQSIDEYRQLKTATLAGNILGCDLPAMQAATLYQTGGVINRANLAACLDNLAIHHGWYQTRDKVATGLPDQYNDLIEGEWFTGTLTVRLKLLSGDSYQLVRCSDAPFDGGQQLTGTAYSEQPVFIRPLLITDGIDLGIYRLWWRLGMATDGPLDGRWLPVAQQFVGFDCSKER